MPLLTLSKKYYICFYDGEILHVNSSCFFFIKKSSLFDTVYKLTHFESNYHRIFSAHVVGRVPRIRKI